MTDLSETVFVSADTQMSSDDIVLEPRHPSSPQHVSDVLSPESVSHGHSDQDRVQQNAVLIAPLDGGFGAWSFLVGAFVIETVIWGFPTTYGVFLQTYLNDPKIASQRHATSVLPLVGTLSSGIIYCSGPFANVIFHRFPSLRRISIVAGMFICFGSLLGASYATTVFGLVATQGILYAIGASLQYAPTMSYMSEWFVQKRGMANGIMNAGTSLGGLFLPLILPHLIKAHGTALTLRYLSIIIIITLAPVLPFVKPRLPQSRVHGPGRRTDNKAWARDWHWWSLVVVNTIQGFGYFVPLIWLPTYASALHASSSISALTVALLNGASVIGRLGMGFLSDRFSPWPLALSALMATSVSTFLLWGVAGGATAGILVFGFTYGLLAAGWTSLWTGFVRPLAKDDPPLFTSLMGFLLFSRGLGNILSTPISTALSTNTNTTTGHRRSGFDVEGGRYGKMIVYVGTCFAGAATLALMIWAKERGQARRVM